MKYLLTMGALALAAIAGAAEKTDGFVPLFNGKDLDGWEIKENPSKTKDLWTVKDGILTARPGSGWLGTKKKYGNFVLWVDWRIAKDGNSGVYLRVPDQPRETPSHSGMEIQVLDDNSPKYKEKIKPWQFSGSIYGVVPCAKRVFRGAGEWNRFEITCRGDQIVVVYNGEKVAEADAGKEPKLKNRPKTGYLGLQNHGSAVEFRNLQIKVLPE